MLRLVDEHRTQRVCNGTDVAAQQLGNSKADVGDVGQQQQCNEHTQVERQGRLDHFLHGALCNGRADEQNGANGRSEQTDAAVQNHDDTELDGIDALGQQRPGILVKAVGVGIFEDAGRLNGKGAVDVDREIAVAGDQTLFFDLTDKV